MGWIGRKGNESVRFEAQPVHRADRWQALLASALRPSASVGRSCTTLGGIVNLTVAGTGMFVVACVLGCIGFMRYCTFMRRVQPISPVSHQQLLWDVEGGEGWSRRNLAIIRYFLWCEFRDLPDGSVRTLGAKVRAYYMLSLLSALVALVLLGLGGGRSL